MSRTPCAIPGCKHTTGRFQNWICSKHWMRLTKAERRVWARIKRAAKRVGWDLIDDRANRVWDAMVRRAQIGDEHGKN